MVTAAKEPVRQCSERVHDGGRWPSFHACSRKGVVADTASGKWYCRQHDPAAVKAKEDRERAGWQAEMREGEAALAASQATAKRLGLGVPYYEHGRGNKLGKYKRALVVPLDDLERLVAENALLRQRLKK